jgi:hypothetical protein
VDLQSSALIYSINECGWVGFLFNKQYRSLLNLQTTSLLFLASLQFHHF